jgi:hypothetical protein
MYYDFPDEIQKFIEGWKMIDGEDEVNKIIAAKANKALNDGYWSGDNNPLANEFINRLIRHAVAVPKYMVHIIGKRPEDDEYHYFAFNDTLFMWVDRTFSASIAKRLVGGERIALTDHGDKVCVCLYAKWEE